MKRSLAVLVIVVLVVLVAATPVLAGGKGQQHQHGNMNRNEMGTEMGTGTGTGMGTGAPAWRGDDGDFNVHGVILSLDGDAAAIELEVQFPAWRIGDNPIVVQTTGDTVFRVSEDGTCTPIEFGDLQVGWQVHIYGTTDGETYTAIRVVHHIW